LPCDGEKVLLFVGVGIGTSFAQRMMFPTRL
jgi:hypothetical protein